MPSLQTAFNFVQSKCLDDNVWYDQSYREGQINPYTGKECYDCSSLMSAALYAGGFFDWYGRNPWFRTYTMDRSPDYWLQNCGFEAHPKCVGGFDGTQAADGVCRDGHYEAWKKGDILIRYADPEPFSWPGFDNGVWEHTEMVYDPDNFITMGAHSSSSGVSINSYQANPNHWSNLMRYNEDIYGGSSTTLSPDDIPWINNSGYEWRYTSASTGFNRNSENALNNACIIYWYTYNPDNGWCKNAIYGLLGYMQTFSGLNPWRTITENAYTADDPIYGVVPWPMKSTLTYEAMSIYGTSVPNTADADVQMNTFLAEYLNMNYRDGVNPQYIGWGNDNYPIEGHTVWEKHDPELWEGCTESNTPWDTWYAWSRNEDTDMYTKARQFMVYYGLAGVDLSQCKVSVNDYLNTLSAGDITSDMSRLGEVYENTEYWAEKLADFVPNGAGNQSNGDESGEQGEDEEIKKRKIFISRPSIKVSLF